MITLRKQYSAKYQVFELTIEAQDWEQVQYESANADAIADKELAKMVELVAKYDDKRESGIVPTPAPKVALASDKQKDLIKKYSAKAKESAVNLGLELDLETLTNKDARAIIDGMFAKK